MSEDLFNIVFKGELVRTFELPAVKKNLGQLFKIDGAKLDALFSGRPVILKRNLNFDAANKYRVAIKKAGARIDVVPVEDHDASAKPPVQPTTVPPKAMGKAVFGERSASAPPSAPERTPPGSAHATAAPDDEFGFAMAPVGADVLTREERKPEVVANIDTSGLSVKQGGGLLIEANEKPPVAVTTVDISALNLSPQQGNLVRPEEIKRPPPLQVDTSKLSVAPPGDRLEAPKPPPPAAPDTSGISLEPSQ